MRLTTIIMSVFAVLFAVGAGLLAQAWLVQQRRIGQPVVAAPPPAKTARIVVATTPMRFGTELSEVNIREIDWPANSLPTGAFATKAELLKAGERRVVLAAVEANEPILKWKITGPGQRASLSSIIETGMKAVTIRVNDVLGVAGFVLPGDRVDIALTRTEASESDGDKTKNIFTDVLLQHVRVLGIDQLADERSDKAAVVKAVTLEVGTEDAQKLVLASSVGTLSLILRPAGSNDTAAVGRVTTRHLGNQIVVASVEPPPVVQEPAVEPPVIRPAPSRDSVVGVTRAISRSLYTVSQERRARQ